MFLHKKRLTQGCQAKELGLAAVALLSLAGCGGDAVVISPVQDTLTNQADRPVVVATTSVICDLTRQIAETTVALTCLLDPGTDPHTYQVKPSDRQALEQADLILYDGYNAAPGLIDLIDNSRTDAPRVAVYERAVPNPLRGAPHDHDHDDDHARDEDHSHADEAQGDRQSDSAGAEVDLVADPHIWHSAPNNGAMALVIANSLTQVNPAQADGYAENADRLVAQFGAIDEWIQTQVATVPAAQRQLVTTHASFGYFAEAYGFEVKGALSGLSTDERPTPGALTALVDQVKAAQVPAIFAETTTNPQLIQVVAKDAGVAVAEQLLFVEGPGGPGSEAETVQAMLVVNTCGIVEALGGSCDRASAPL